MRCSTLIEFFNLWFFGRVGTLMILIGWDILIGIGVSLLSSSVSLLIEISHYRPSYPFQLALFALHLLYSGRLIGIYPTQSFVDSVLQSGLIGGGYLAGYRLV